VVKWGLVALGAFAGVGLAINEWHEGRVALGTGIVAALALALVKGVFMALSAAPPPPHRNGPESP
jgi:hypothetical protein